MSEFDTIFRPVEKLQHLRFSDKSGSMVEELQHRVEKLQLARVVSFVYKGCRGIGKAICRSPISIYVIVGRKITTSKEEIPFILSL